jgi:hypothetical protein
MLKKIGLGIILTASFGLMSCEDSSSSSSGGKVTVSCKVVSEDPFTIKSSEAGISGNMTYELKDGKVVETYKFDDSSIAKDECNDMKSRGGYSKVTCDGKKVVAYSEDEMTDAEFKQYKKSLKKYCEDMDGKTIDINDWGDDDDEVPGGNEGGSPAVQKSPCDFSVNDNVWEYTFSTAKDATGTTTKGSVRYEFKDADLTVIRTTTSTGSLPKSVCPTTKQNDYVDEDDEYGSYKVETTCKGEDMISKSTEVIHNYEQNYDTKKNMLAAFKAQCQAL